MKAILIAKIYIATPYTNNKELAFIESSKLAARLMEGGNIVFSPISHSHPVQIYGKPESNDLTFWLKQDLFWLEKCDVLVILQLPAWNTSAGVSMEIDFAMQHGIPIVYLPWRIIDNL